MTSATRSGRSPRSAVRRRCKEQKEFHHAQSSCHGRRRAHSWKEFAIADGLAAKKNAKLVPHMGHVVTITGDVSENVRRPANGEDGNERA